MPRAPFKLLIRLSHSKGLIRYIGLAVCCSPDSAPSDIIQVEWGRVPESHHVEQVVFTKLMQIQFLHQC